jgi:hypothetical protein
MQREVLEKIACRQAPLFHKSDSEIRSQKTERQQMALDDGGKC